MRNIWHFSIIFIAVISTPAIAVSPAWPTQGGSFQRTGSSSYCGPEQGCIQWEFTTGDSIGTSIAIGAEEDIYLTSEDGYLYAVDPNGNEIWRYDADSSVTSSPTIGHDGTIYIGTSAGELQAVDPNGSQRWSVMTQGSIYTCPTIVSALIVVGSMDGGLYAFETDSDLAWQFPSDGPDSIITAPGVGMDGTLYAVRLYDPHVYAIDPADGSELWSTDLSHHIIADDPTTNFIHTGFQISPVVHPDGMILIAPTHDTKLYALDPADGAILWSLNLYQFPEKPVDATIDDFVYGSNYGYSDIWSEPVIGPDGTIYVSMDDMYLRAVNPDGTLKWSQRIGMYGGLSMTVDANGVIYAASDDKSVYVIDPADGAILSVLTLYGAWQIWPAVADEEWLSSPVLGKDGLLYVSSSSGKVYAVASGNGQPKELHWLANLSGDQQINLEDLARLADEWQVCLETLFPGEQCAPDTDSLNFPYPKADINRDFYVNMDDLGIFVENWLQEENL